MMRSDSKEGTMNKKKELTNNLLPGALIVKAFAVIHALSQRQEMGIKALALETQMSGAMVYKCILTLCQLGYAYQNEQTQQYGLTLKLASVCSNILNHYNITEMSMPLMKNLGEKVGETIHLALREGTELIYLYKIDSAQSLRLYSRVGKMAPLYCTGVGKALLAFERENIIKKIVSKINFVVYTEHTIKNAKEFMQELEKIRRQGYAEDLEEHERYIRCIAAPIFDYDNNVCAALSISMPSVRWTQEIGEMQKGFLLEIAKKISYLLGCEKPNSQLG